MKYRYLGNSGLAVSTVCLGTLTFGQEEWGCNEKIAHEIIGSYTEKGGNFIDTSDQYADTQSEQIIGNWLNNKERENYVIATKCGFSTSDSINNRGLSCKHIIHACEGSLKRLKTDYIDIYQVYGFDPQTPLEETLHAIDILIKQGKVRYFGISNYPAWKIVKFSNAAEKNNIPAPVSGQYLYNLLKRDIEAEIIPACLDGNLGIVCWSPLSGGMLSGKYVLPATPPEGSRLASRSDLTADRYKLWYEHSLKIVEKLKEIAVKYNQTPSIIALAWILRNNSISSVIAGARKSEQIVENCIAGEWILPDDEYFDLEKISKIKFGYPHNWCTANNKDWYKDIML